MIEARIDYLNRLTGNTESNKYHLSMAYGGHALHQQSGTSSGIKNSGSGYLTKKELYNYINQLISGIEIGKEL